MMSNAEKSHLVSWGRGQCERGVPSEPTEKGHCGDLRQAKKGELAGHRGKRTQAGWTVRILRQENSWDALETRWIL